MGNAKLLLIITIAALMIQPVHADTDNAISMRYLVQTTSDWTQIHVTGCGDIRLTNITNLSPYNLTITPEPDGFTIWIGKPQYDRTLTQVKLDLVTINPADLNVTITKGYIGFTSIKLSAWTGTWYRRVTRIIHKKTPGDQSHNHYSKVILRETLERYHINLVSTATPGSEVLAIYYPWYDILGVSGVGRHWGNVTNDTIEESLNYPLLGVYSSQNQSLIKRHITQAENHGITCFTSSWWGKDTYEDQAFKLLLDNCGEFKACIYYETNRDTPRTPEEITDELNYIITRYGNHSGYLRYREKPVILVFNAAGENRTLDFWERVRDQTLDCCLVGDFRDPSLVAVFDGVHIYNELDLEIHRALTHWISRQDIVFPSTINGFNSETRNGYLLYENKLTVGTVSPGYDDTKIRPNGVAFPRNGNTTYQGYWENILCYPVDWVLITSWNEWHESTEIEPSRENGYHALRYTKKMIKEWSHR